MIFIGQFLILDEGGEGEKERGRGRMRGEEGGEEEEMRRER